MNKLPMNLPNRLTLLRIALIPVYFLFMVTYNGLANWPAAAVFAIASITDWLDGRIARKNGQITDFGKFIDPIADKLLVLLPMIYLAVGGSINVWAVIIMVAREVIVSGFRLVAVTKGTVIAAGWTGKIKTLVQMLCVMMLTLGMQPLGGLTAWVAAILSLYSGAEILIKNRAMLEEAA